MKVFISWSGNISNKIGEIFRSWLPSVLQSVKPYFTPSDIEKGARWNTEIAQELEDSKVGILCVTRENLNSAWLLFEAGALSKQLEKSHVCPILFGINNSDLQGPLNQFQSTSFNEKEFYKLITTINSQLAEDKLEEPVLKKVFDKWWPDLEDQVNGVMKEQEGRNATPIRTERDLLEEILQITRLINKKDVPQIPLGTVTHLLHHFRTIYNLVEKHSLDTEVMVALEELSRSVLYISKQLFPQENESHIINIQSLRYICDNIGDDVPF